MNAYIRALHKNKWEIALAIGIILSLVIRVAYIAGYGYETDIGSRSSWAKTVKDSGIGNFYSSGADYPPLIAYLLYFLPSETVPELKFPAVAADVLLAAAIFFALRRTDKKLAVISSLLFALNPAAIFNSAIWGQNDSILALFAVLSLVFFTRGKIPHSWLFMTLAVLFKAQGAVFIPLLFYATLKLHRNEIRGAMLVSAAVFAAALLPFALSGNLDSAVRAYSGSVGAYPYTSMNAYNLWWLALDGKSVIDTGQAFISYRTMGMLLFGGFYLLLLSRMKKTDFNGVFSAAALVSLAFFILPTQMHERYMFNVFAFMPLVLFTKKIGLNRNLIAYASLSFTYLANMAIVLGSIWPGNNPWQFLTSALSGYTMQIALLNLALFLYLSARLFCVEEIASRLEAIRKPRITLSISNRKFFAMFALVLLVALLFRFYALDARLLHHDEGVFAISFIKPLYESGEYRYDPNGTYHGPLLFYLGALSFSLFGVTEFALRFWPALFGALLVIPFYLLRKRIGCAGAMTAALLAAASPVMVYYSREAMVHENFFIFFQLAAIAAFFLYQEKRQSKYLYAGFASLGFMFTTKETSYAITFLLVLFLVLEFVLKKTKQTYRQSVKENMKSARAFLSENKKDILISILIAFSIFAVFYTSFFRHADNLVAAMTGALPALLSTSATSVGHYKPFLYYTELLAGFELPMLALAIVGLAQFRKSLFNRFAAYLLVATWLMFSVVAYKTPWNILHIMLPLAIVAGIGCQELYRRFGRTIIPVFIIVIAYTAWVSFDTNYINHSSQDNQLAYVTTTPGIADMVGRIHAYNTSAEINVLSNEYWPLPWYLRNYTRTGYYGRIIDKPDADIVIAKREDMQKLEGNLTDTYDTADYQLRYGVWLTAFFRVNTTDSGNS